MRTAIGGIGVRGASRALAPAAIGFALTLAYASMVQPAWEPQHTDQLQYLSLARGLVERGEFTRASGVEAYFPETYRLPGYPLFLAPLCIGGCDHWRIALAQAALVAALVLAAYGLARRLLPTRATTAALAVALFTPFAYYGALALSDLPGTVLFGVGVLAWVRALEDRSPRLAIVAGALFGWAALIRGVLILAPVALAVVAVVKDRGWFRVAAAAIIATAVVFGPYVAYSVSSYGRVTGGTGGLVLWLGAFQGRDEASLDTFERTAADAARVEIAEFDAMSDRADRSLAWLALDDKLGARARAVIAHDPIGWAVRAIPRSLVLWAGERPLPGGGPDDLATALGAIQLVLFAGAAFGVIQLLRRGDPVGTAVAVAILYVWLSALPFQTEARYALPAKMPAILAAVAFVDKRWPRSRAAKRGPSTG